MRQKYETDLTDEQWEVIAPLFVNMRKRKWDKRELINAVLYLVKVTRQKARLREKPTQALIDSQSVKTTGAVEQKGFDAGKKRKE